jgi:hypothetical protein
VEGLPSDFPLFFRVFFGVYARRDGLLAALSALVPATILFRCDLDLRMELSVGMGQWLSSRVRQHHGRCASDS